MKLQSNFSRKLLKWYKAEKRSLPWRLTNDPYKIWISEIMLQQTTVNAVIPYYEKWIKTFPTVEVLASSLLQKILKEWQGLGYYQRARNAYKSAQIIVKDFKGCIPSEEADLRKLPGFGPYTCAAVLSIAYKKPMPLVDANVRRVFWRILNFTSVMNPKEDKRILGLIKEIIPLKHPGDFNQALMELGALICRSKNPVCNACPVSDDCLAFQNSTQELIPVTEKKPKTDISAVIGIIEHKEKILIQQRPEKGLLAGLWEFPGGKIENNENALQALKREIFEETKIKISTAEHFMDCIHFYTQFRVNLKVFYCHIDETPVLKKNQKWISKKYLKKYPMPSGSAKIILQILKNK